MKHEFKRGSEQIGNKDGAKMKIHILIVNLSSFKMTLSDNLCKHFYIRSKIKQWRKEKSVRSPPPREIFFFPTKYELRSKVLL